MRHSIALALLGAFFSVASPVLAQQTIAQDTMSMSSPVAIECGFCATEAYGVIFREVGSTGGIQPGTFPLRVDSVLLAIGAADVTGTTPACHGLAAGGDTVVHLEIWAGTTLPDANDIHAMPVAGMPWPGEDMVISLDDVPVTMSTPTVDGGADFNLMLNTLNLGDATNPAPVVDAPHNYLRAVVVLGDSGMSSACTPATNAPTGFPLRDNDGVVSNHRPFIYATGAGWLWNEAASIHGDWGIRLVIEPLPHADAGVADAGAADAGATDGGSTSDASSMTDAGRVAGGGSSSCGCRASGPTGAPSIALTLIALALYSRKVTRPKRSGT